MSICSIYLLIFEPFDHLTSKYKKVCVYFVIYLQNSGIACQCNGYLIDHYIPHNFWKTLFRNNSDLPHICNKSLLYNQLVIDLR